MPIYEIKCMNCGKKEEHIIGLSELPEPNSKGNFDLEKLGIRCKKCRTSVFKKLISAHGKTALNWSDWQNGPAKVSTKSPKKVRSPKK